MSIMLLSQVYAMAARKSRFIVLHTALLCLVVTTVRARSVQRSAEDPNVGLEQSGQPPPLEKSATDLLHETTNQSWVTCWRLNESLSMNTTAEAERMRRPACSRPQPGSEDTWLQVRHEPLNNFFQEIKSPRFPEPYPAAFECQWSFTVPAHHRYKLVTTHAEFEYSADPDCHDNHSDTSHVEVVSVGREPLRLKKYCGNRIRRTHVITGDYHKSPTVHVCFRSSGQPAQRAKGFRAVFFTYPKHGLIAFNTERSDAALLKQSELSHCAKPRCVRNYGPQDERTKFYYDAGAIKSLLKSTLKDANESALNGTHACRHHPIHQMLVDGARTNSGDFLWQSFHGRDGTRNPCAGGHRTRRRAARTP